MDKLLEGIDEKREAIVTSRPPTIKADIPEDLQPRIAERVRKAMVEDVAHRIWKKDDTLWGPAGQAEVANRLGWLTIGDTMREAVDDLEAFAREIRDEGFQDVVLLGMGGSSLAPEVIRLSFGDQDGWPVAARARLDRRGRDPRDPRPGRPRQDPVPRLDEVGRDDRDAVAVQGTSGRCGPRAASSSRSPTRAPAWPTSRASTASGARSSTTPRSAGATARCRTSGSSPRR